MLLRTREALRTTLGAYGQRPNNFSLIHADLHPDNIICNGNDLALIDFDDSAYGWHLYVFATALIEYRAASDFEALRAAQLDSYREHRPLAAADLKMLPVFLLIRGVAIVGWFHRRPEHAGSSVFEQIKDLVLEECEKLVGGTGTP